MITFELQVGTKYRLQGGLQAELIRHLKCGYFVGIIVQANGVEKIAEFTKNGTFIDPFGVPDEKYDIIDVWTEKRKVVVFVNVYENGVYAHNALSNAQANAIPYNGLCGKFLKTVKVETEIEV